MSGDALVAWSILVPLAGAVAALAAGPRGGRWAGLLTAPVALAAHLALAARMRAGGPVRHLVGGWGAPLGIDLLADGLSALMLVMTGAVGLLVTVHAFAYFEDHGEPGPAARADGARRRLLFWPLWLFLWAALAALFLTRDVFNVYVTLELVGLSAVALVALAGEPAALSAAARYLVLALLGSLAYLLGVGLAYAGHATLDADGLRAALRPGLLTAAVAALVGAGLCVKAAVFPLHGWLPPAHGAAPSPVSAVLSALVVKASFYLLLRWWGEILPGAGLDAASTLLGAMGALAILWGSVQALRQARLKQVIAYSTVAQLGYLFLWFPLSRPLQRGGGAQVAGAIIDLGEGAVKMIEPYIQNAKLILWNGPLGKYESDGAESTKSILKLVANSKAKSIIGGGDTVALISEMDMGKDFTFVSTGGGATLDFLANGTLPGIKALQ